ncbi:DUF445 domain-containing protein [Clostridium sp. SHJSY1]|uniref:DUF445 domain-containing protein n=1 Tax=Clostridium sp. SHJSY1 TaxID=2942483 RepID=UPI0028741BB7|nr:DUF445 domain-containing protein [Clostridium sp. SHJSY1]MDS0526472.1 DUF445 domain-containing protein [Clostridium sp. SHJSY1]
MGRSFGNRKSKNGNIATCILLFFSVGFFISYTFHDSFLGGLISSLCLAAMIGGLADWFAVVALFRKPLNSKLLAKLFRTEIIPKNRERIFEALVEMVEKELLTKESIMNKIQDINASKVLQQLSEAEKKRELIIILDNIFKEILVDLDKEFENEIIRSSLKSIELSKIISQIIEWMWNNGYKEKIIDIVVDKLEELSKTYQVKMLLKEAVVQILELNRGNFLVMVLGFFIKGNLENIATTIQEKLVEFIGDIRKQESSEREYIESFIRKQIGRLNEDEELKEKIEGWKLKRLDKIEEILVQYISKLKSENDKTYNVIENLLDGQLEDFISNDDKQLKVNKSINGLIEKLVKKNHHKIGLMVKEKLDNVSGEELSNMIEPIIGNDLQLIRVNGSLVGGGVGIITYIMTFWIV